MTDINIRFDPDRLRKRLKVSERIQFQDFVITQDKRKYTDALGVRIIALLMVDEAGNYMPADEAAAILNDLDGEFFDEHVMKEFMTAVKDYAANPQSGDNSPSP